MLTTTHTFRADKTPRIRQTGVVLLISLIVLVALTLATIALVRSVDTTNLIAGNLSFKQAAIHSADIGTETAIAWIEQNSTSGVLQNDVTGQGYLSSWVDPTSGQTLDSFWNQQLKPYAVGPLPTDSAGNQVSYVIQRLCAASGDPLLSTTGCAITIPSSSSQNLLNSVTASSTQLPAPGQIYYRITSRIDGPRGAVSYVQTIVAK